MAAKTAPKPAGLRIRLLADREGADRVKRFDPITGEVMLVDPADHSVDDRSDAPNWLHKPWPLAGVQIDGDIPRRARVPTSSIEKWVSEGWCELVGERVVTAPGGPPDDPHSREHMHIFRQADEVVLHTVDGDVRYRVTRQPGKYVDPDPDGPTAFEHGKHDPAATRVDWFFDLALEG